MTGDDEAERVAIVAESRRSEWVARARAKRIAGQPIDENERRLLGLPLDLTTDIREIVPSNPMAARLVSVDDTWLTEAPPEREYLLTDLRTGRGAVPAHGVALLVAAGGAGKSHTTIGLGVAVATCAPWAGAMRPTRHGRVLFVTAEDPAAEMRRRVYAACRTLGVESLPFASVEVVDVHDAHTPLVAADGSPTEHARALIELCAARGPYSLVVVDPVARLAGVSIDADNSMACALVGVLEQVATAARGLVLAVHHTSQGARRAGIVDATAARGATGLADSARMVLVLASEVVGHEDPDVADRLGEIVTIHLAKANHVRRWEPIRLRRGHEGVLVPLDTHDSALVAEAMRSGGPASQRAAARASQRETRDAREVEALRAIVGGSPGIVTRQLRALLSARLGVRSGSAAEIIDRGIATGLLRTEPGPRNSTHHHLADHRDPA